MQLHQQSVLCHMAVEEALTRAVNKASLHSAPLVVSAEDIHTLGIASAIVDSTYPEQRVRLGSEDVVQVSPFTSPPVRQVKILGKGGVNSTTSGANSNNTGGSIIAGAGVDDSGRVVTPPLHISPPRSRGHTPPPSSPHTSIRSITPATNPGTTNTNTIEATITNTNTSDTIGAIATTDSASVNNSDTFRRPRSALTPIIRPPVYVPRTPPTTSNKSISGGDTNGTGVSADSGVGGESSNVVSSGGSNVGSGKSISFADDGTAHVSRPASAVRSPLRLPSTPESPHAQSQSVQGSPQHTPLETSLPTPLHTSIHSTNNSAPSTPTLHLPTTTTNSNTNTNNNTNYTSANTSTGSTSSDEGTDEELSDLEDQAQNNNNNDTNTINTSDTNNVANTNTGDSGTQDVSSGVQSSRPSVRVESKPPVSIVFCFY